MLKDNIDKGLVYKDIVRQRILRRFYLHFSLVRKELTEEEAYRSIKLVQLKIINTVNSVVNEVNENETIINSFKVEALELPCMEMIRKVIEEPLEFLKYDVYIQYLNGVDVVSIKWYFERKQ